VKRRKLEPKIILLNVLEVEKSDIEVFFTFWIFKNFWRILFSEKKNLENKKKREKLEGFFFPRKRTKSVKNISVSVESGKLPLE